MTSISIPGILLTNRWLTRHFWVISTLMTACRSAGWQQLIFTCNSALKSCAETGIRPQAPQIPALEAARSRRKRAVT